MAISKHGWRVLAGLEFQPQCNFPVDGDKPEGRWCRRPAVWALYRVACDCDDIPRVWLACNGHRRWIHRLDDPCCGYCGTNFEDSVFEVEHRLTIKG